MSKIKYIEKKSVAPIDPVEGAVVDTTNIDNKTTNTYSANIIDGLVQRHILQMYVTSAVDVTTDSTNFAKIPCNTSLKVGNKLTFNSSNNAIVVGAGVKVVGISGAINHKGRGSVNEGVNVYINGVSNLSYVFSGNATLSYTQNDVPLRIVSVKEGDVITMHYRSVSQSNITKTINGGTTLIVEVLA